MLSLYQACQEELAGSRILSLAFSKKACKLCLLAIGCSLAIKAFLEEMDDCRKRLFMAGIEGRYRPQNKEALFDASVPGGGAPGGERYERSEVHYGGIATPEIRLRNGVLKDICHVYTERQADGQLRWWTDRQSMVSWVEEVRAGKERRDPRYEHIPEEQVPSSITHTSSTLYESGKAPIYGYRNWVHLHFDHPAYPDQIGSHRPHAIYVLDSPEAGTGNGAEPKQERGREEQGQGVFAAGRGKNDLHEDAQQRPIGASSEDESYQNLGQGEQRNRRSYGGASTTDTEEHGELAKARAVLQTIVNTREDTIDETTPIDRIAGLTTEQVRQAERAVAQRIINKGGGFDIVTKRTPQGRLEMYFGDVHEEGKWEVALYLSKVDSDQIVVENRYALTQPLAGMEHHFGFKDYRPGGKEANLGYLALHDEKDRQLDDIRTMWRGLRWMNVNLLHWDKPNAILPEELDGKPLRSDIKPTEPQR